MSRTSAGSRIAAIRLGFLSVYISYRQAESARVPLDPEVVALAVWVRRAKVGIFNEMGKRRPASLGQSGTVGP